MSAGNAAAMRHPRHLDAAPAYPFRLAAALPDSAPVVVTIGHVAPGIDMVVHAMALLRNEHPDLHYVVVGPTHPELARRDGERYRWCLEALAENLGVADRVHLLDGPADVARHGWLLDRCRAVVVPYRSAEFAVRHPVLTAAAAGTPVIATRACAPSTLIGGGVTIAIDADDDEACAAAIHQVVDAARSEHLMQPGAARLQTLTLS